MIQPHGGRLVDRVLVGKDKEAALSRAGRLPRLTVDSELISDIENIATGVYSPLEGFLCEADFRSVLAGSRLESDVAWTVPIVLDADAATAAGLKTGAEALLAATQAKLGNAQFLERAPAAVVEKERARAAEGEARLTKLQAQLQDLE